MARRTGANSSSASASSGARGTPHEPSMTVPDPFQDGLRQHRAGDLQGAATLYRKALEANPGHFDACNNLGVVFASCGETEPALACWREAIKMRPDSVDARINLTAALHAAGQIDAAAEALAEAIRLAPAEGPLHMNLGLLRRQQKAPPGRAGLLPHGPGAEPDGPREPPQPRGAAARGRRSGGRRRALSRTAAPGAHPRRGVQRFRACCSKKWARPSRRGAASSKRCVTVPTPRSCAATWAARSRSNASTRRSTSSTRRSASGRTSTRRGCCAPTRSR